MLSKIKDQTDDDADLITPEQIKRFVDRMISNSQFNDEYVSATVDWEKYNSVDRHLLSLELEAKKCRNNLVKKDISGVREEIKELCEQLNFPIKPGSTNELLVGRALLRAQADYYEEYVRRERKERGLPDSDSASLSLEDLQEKVRAAWQRKLHPEENSGGPISPAKSINTAQGEKTKEATNPRPTKFPEDAAQDAGGPVIGERRGRAPVYKWDAVALFVEEKLNKNGHWEASPVEGWRSQSDLEKMVIRFLTRDDGAGAGDDDNTVGDDNYPTGDDDTGGPSVSSVRKNIKPMIDKWLKDHPDGL